jgi:diacylglycerol kinase (ATP)
VLIIANPVSGRGRGRARAEGLAAALAARGIAHEVRFTTLDRRGRDLAREAVSERVRALAVVGGDGSLHDAIAGLSDPRVPVAVMPAGTANVWAREAGIPPSAPAVAAMIEARRTKRVRLYEANDAPFFLFVGAGIDARIVARVEAGRRRRGHTGGMSQWLVPGWSEFLRRPLPDLTVTAEGERWTDLAQVLVTRVRSYAGFMSMPRGIDIGDGVLHVLAFPRRAKAAFVPMAARAVLGRMRVPRDLRHVITTGPVHIESARGGEPYQVDGDDAGELPVDIRPGARTVDLIVP